MFVLKWIRWLMGYVVFTAVGGFPERFLNLTARSGEVLWDVSCKNRVFTASTFARRYKELRASARKSGMRLKVAKKRGLPFLLHRYRRRAGVFVGILVFFAVIQVLSLYIWTVNIPESEHVPADELRQVLCEAGLSPGSLKREIDPTYLEEKAMIAFPDISWIAVNLQGNVASVEFTERQKAPEMVPVDEPCNIKASFHGQIIRLDVYSGTAEVKNGDAVVQGQLLISGVVEDKYGGSTLEHASGMALAATEHTLREEVPLTQKTLTPTGKVIVRRRATLFGVELPLSFVPAPGENYEREISSEALTVGGVTLPVTLLTEQWREMAEQEITLSEQEAAAQAAKKMAEREKEELSEAKIVGKTEKAWVENGTYILEVTYSCEEDIAIEEAILWNDPANSQETET